MINKKVFFLFYFFVMIYHGQTLSEIKIIQYVDDEIITNYDLKIETEYLKILNPNLKQLNFDQLNQLAKKSLIKEIIKKKEIEKYKNLKAENLILDEYLEQIFLNLNISSKKDFIEYLKIENYLDINEIKKKLKIELLWNELIFIKYSRLVNIDKDLIKKKINNLSKDKTKDFLLSEIVFSKQQNIPLDRLIYEIKLSINEIGFNNTANIYSISDSSKKGGNIGWINENNLSKKISNKLNTMSIGEFTDLIQLNNNFLILKIENIRENTTELDIKAEIDKLIKLETNKQLSKFSKIYYDKIKLNFKINES